MAYDVVVVGNAGIDTNVYLPGQDIDFSVEANFTQNIDTIGQAGSYAARGYASLDLKVGFIGAVGADANGAWIRQVFAGQGIGVEGFFDDPQGTSRSINIMYKDGRRKNFYDGKSHMKLKAPLELSVQMLQGARLAHFNIPNWARELLPLARSSGARIASDIQDVVDPADPYRKDFICNSDFLFFSAANHADPESLMRYFWTLNPDLEIVAGMGEQGCTVGERQNVRRYPALSIDLPVVDTNGAGDALAVGYLVARVFDGAPPSEAARRGQLAARFTCAQKASSDHLITREILNRYLWEVHSNG